MQYKPPQCEALWNGADDLWWADVPSRRRDRKCLSRHKGQISWSSRLGSLWWQPTRSLAALLVAMWNPARALPGFVRIPGGADSGGPVRFGTRGGTEWLQSVENEYTAVWLRRGVQLSSRLRFGSGASCAERRSAFVASDRSQHRGISERRRAGHGFATGPQLQRQTRRRAPDCKNARTVSIDVDRVRPARSEVADLDPPLDDDSYSCAGNRLWQARTAAISRAE